MRGGTSERIVIRLYRVVLHLLPARLRASRGREMELLFRDRLREVPAGRWRVRLLLVIRELVDVARVAASTRRGERVRLGAGGNGPALARQIVHDLWTGARHSTRRPVTAVLAVVIIALGMASTASIFAVVDAVALRPLGHEEPDRLVVVGQTVPSLGSARVPMAGPNYADIRATAGTGLVDLAAFRWPGSLRVSTGGSPEVAAVSSVSGGLFALLGNGAALGRVIDAADDSSGARVAVLSSGFWKTRFGADAGAVGRTLVIEGESYEIIGVMGPAFSFPDRPADVFVPLPHVPAMQDRDTRFLGVIGRIEPGLDIAEVRRRMDGVMAGLVRAYPVDNEGNGIRIDSWRSVVIGDAQPIMALLFGAVLVLLLLSCASVASLLLARTAARESEFAVRRALGAGRARVASHVLGEGLALAIAGGVIGFGVAAGGINLLSSLVPASLPRTGTIGMDVRTTLFAVAATVACGLLFGLAPAWRSAGSRTAAVLREATGSVGERSRQRLLRWIVAGQIALTAMLLVGGGLLLNSFVRLTAVDPGLEVDGVATIRVSLPAEYDDPARVDGFFRTLIERAEALPGITAAGATWALPFTRDWASGRVTAEGDPRPRGDELLIGMIPVSGAYFEALGVDLVEGRVFDDADYAAARAGLANLTEDGPPPGPGLAVVNAAAAHTMWPGVESVVGRRFRRGRAEEEGRWLIVIGVVGDTRRFGLEAAAEPEYYQMHPQALWARDMSIVARSELDPAAMVAPLARIVRDLDPTLAVTQAGSLADFVRQSIAEPRFRTFMVAAFGAASLALALAGVYGVLSLAVSLTTPEIGVRMALGAGRARVLTGVLAEGGWLIGGGLILGLLGAAAGARLLRSQLFGVGPFDATTWLAAALLMGLTGAVACWIPARRASRIPPVRAMRSR
jgi:putative ABC transport system permease protein